MNRMWLLAACLAIVLTAPAAAGECDFDLWSCLKECEYRYNVERDAWGGGAIILPRDTPRRLAYQECVEDCNKKSWSCLNDKN